MRERSLPGRFGSQRYNWHVGAVVAGLKTLELTGMGGKKSAGYGDLELALRA